MVFGHLGDIIGKESLDMVTCGDVGEVRGLLLAKYPGLQTASFQVSVNRQIVTDEFPVNENDELALLPPFAGG